MARRGRAVAVSLVAATQKPTQAAMGKDSAVRSQMDVRIALRVRERRDVDLIIGQGSLNAGWDARQLTKPGEFLLPDPEHHAPDKCLAYLLTDDRITRHAAACTPLRPTLPPGTPDMSHTAPEPQKDNRIPNVRDDDRDAAEAALCAALRAAGPRGATVAELMAASGMRRSWVYYRLAELADEGSAEQVARGRWRGRRVTGHRPRPRLARARLRALAACSAVDVDITERSEINWRWWCRTAQQRATNNAEKPEPEQMTYVLVLPDQRITLPEMLAHIEAGKVVFLILAPNAPH